MTTVVEFFAGCGGFSLGAYAAHLSPNLAIDIDPILTSSYAVNFPKSQLLLADISKLDGASIRRRFGGHVDVIFGGPPCQGFSDIGLRDLADPRRTLLGDFFRLVAELRPSVFVMENVRGLMYSDARPVLDAGIELLGGRYEILGPTILDAADFGAATRRPRLFVIGYDRNRCDAISLSELEAVKKKAATVRQAIADLSSAVPIGEMDGLDIWKIVRPGPASRYADQLRNEDNTFTGHRRTKHTSEVAARFAKVEQGATDAVGRHPRLHWDRQCPTLRAGTGNDRGSYQSVRPIHPEEPRVITVREGARLQGFPDHFRFHSTIWHSFRMIGNSVSPLISQAIFSLIAKRIGSKPHYVTAAE